DVHLLGIGPSKGKNRGQCRQAYRFLHALSSLLDPLFVTFSTADQRAVALLERPESFIGRDCCAELVEVPRIFRFSRRFDLKQVSGMKLAAIGANRAFAE